MFKLLMVFALLCPIAVFGQKSPSVDDRIQEALRDFRGKVWIYAKNLDNGKVYSLRGDERVRTASTIKLPIMIETYFQVSEGKVNWADEIILAKEKKVGGSGVLGEFSDNTKIDLRTAVNLMIVVSDNTATNLVIEKVTSDAVNARMESLGFPSTKSIRRIFGTEKDSKVAADPVIKNFGLGMSTPREMAGILELLETGKIINAEASKSMLDVLRRQQYKDGIGRNALDTVPIASKSGTLDRLRADVGIAYTRRGRIVMAITVDDMPVVHYSTDNEGSLMIWRLSQILQDGL
ncbi:MAG: serine hydrolase [Acidobacteria bacterium]|nr:serine hydrolase [Acidobacteriota bacterium]MBK8149423.1 serine hydrolase [Acidobacteriota bacterium]MBK8813826.1 serine hydrolase [Acidobacteriota bacterium]